METRFSYFAVGIFMSLITALVLFFVLDVIAKGRVSENMQEFGIVVRGNVKGIKQGSLITFNGIDAGYVDRVEFDAVDPTAVYIGVLVDERVPVNTSTRANLSSTGFTGRIFINLTTKKADAKKIAIKENRQQPIIIAQKKDLFFVIEKITAVLDEAERSIKVLSQIVSLNKDSVSNTIENVNSVLQKMKDVLENISITVNTVNDTTAGLNTKSVEIAESVSKVLIELNFLVQDTRAAVRNVLHITNLIEQNPTGFIFQGRQGVLQLPEYEGKDE